MSKSSIYFCHTPYHVFITIIKNINYSGVNDIVLCNTIPNYEKLVTHLNLSKIFKNVYTYNEIEASKKFNEQQLENKFFRTNQTIKLFEKYFKVDLKDYNGIYVYNDWSTVGAYLMDKRIYYHLIEDGIDAFYYIKENFRNKITFLNPNFMYYIKYLVKKLCHRGYDYFGQSKYVIDIEVNDKSNIFIKNKNVIQIPKKELYASLNGEQKKQIYNIFINESVNFDKEKKNLLLLTQPLYKDKLVDSLDRQVKAYEKIMDDYKEYNIYIKPHPRDDYDYTKYQKCIIIDRFIPIEIMNYNEGAKFDIAITIFSSSIKSLEFVKEKIELGLEYLERRSKQ